MYFYDAGALLKAGPGSNCIWMEGCVIPSPVPSTEMETELTYSSEIDLDVAQSGILNSNVIPYISGSIQRKVIRLINCDDCQEALEMLDNSASCSLIELNDKGRLVRPNVELVWVVNLVNNIVDLENKCCDILSAKNITAKLTSKTLEHIFEKRQSLFDSGCQNPNHKFDLLKHIIRIFLNVKLGHLCKLKNQGYKKNLRHINKKLPIFNHE